MLPAPSAKDFQILKYPTRSQKVSMHWDKDFAELLSVLRTLKVFDIEVTNLFNKPCVLKTPRPPTITEGQQTVEGR